MREPLEYSKDENRLLKDENERLRAEIDEFKRQLAHEYSAPREWMLTALEERIVGLLVKSESCSKDMLFNGLYGDRLDQPDPKIVDVFICKIRKKLAPFEIEIETLWGRGYRLSDRSRAQLRSSA